MSFGAADDRKRYRWRAGVALLGLRSVVGSGPGLSWPRSRAQRRSIHDIDVSEFQDEVDWNAVASGGSRFEAAGRSRR